MEVLKFEKHEDWVKMSLLGPVNGRIVVFHEGLRYGGFASIEAALYFVRDKPGAIINRYAVEPAEEDCRQAVLESCPGVEVIEVK